MSSTFSRNPAVSAFALAVLALGMGQSIRVAAETRPVNAPPSQASPKLNDPLNDSRFNELAAAAEEARKSGDQTRAIALYRQTVQLTPTWPDGWWFLGSLEYAASDYLNARDALTHFINLSPPAGPATALRGLCEFETGEYSQALTDIQSGLAHGAATQPRNERVLRAHEALLLTRNGRFEDALHTYAFFAHQGAPDPQMAAGVGLAGLRETLLPADLPPEHRELFIATGNAIFQFIVGDPAAARQAFEALLQRYPATPNLHYIYGYFLVPTDPELADREFRRELQVDPSNAPAESMLAWAASLRGDAAAAKPFAQSAVTDDPNLPLGQLVLGRVLLESGVIVDGIARLEKAQQLDPTNLESHLALARAYSEVGRKLDAQRERLQSLALSRNELLARP